MNPRPRWPTQQGQETFASLTKHKYDILDWKKLAQFPGPFDLNFRLPVDYASEALRLLAYVSLVWVLACLVALLPDWVLYVLAARELAGAGILISVILALRAAVLPTEKADQTGGKERLGRVFVVLQVPLVIWMILETLPYLAYFSALNYLVALPLVLVALWWLADRVASQHLGWLSAQPRLPRERLVYWRNVWRERFRGVPPAHLPANPMEASDSQSASDALPRPASPDQATLARRGRCLATLRQYPFAGLSLFVAWPLALVLVRTLHPPTSLAVGRLLLGLYFGIVVLVLAAWRNREHLGRNYRQVALAIISYVGYGRGLVAPGWCFHSSSGSARQRLGRVLVVVGFCTFVLVKLSNCFPVFLLYPPRGIPSSRRFPSSTG